MCLDARPLRRPYEEGRGPDEGRRAAMVKGFVPGPRPPRQVPREGRGRGRPGEDYDKWRAAYRSVLKQIKHTQFAPPTHALCQCKEDPQPLVLKPGRSAFRLGSRLPPGGARGALNAVWPRKRCSVVT